MRILGKCEKCGVEYDMAPPAGCDGRVYSSWRDYFLWGYNGMGGAGNLCWGLSVGEFCPTCWEQKIQLEHEFDEAKKEALLRWKEG